MPETPPPPEDLKGSEPPPPAAESVKSSSQAPKSVRDPNRPLSSVGGGDPLLTGGVDRIARLQTLAAVVLGLALIAIPLYLWRRPRSESVPVTSALDASVALSDAGVAAAASATAAIPAAPQVVLSEPKVMECHDVGSRHTRPEDCDHLSAVEKAFAAAITANSACLPPSAGGGTLVYVLDASFNRKHRPFELFVPRDGRGLKNAHASVAATNACGAAVKHAVDAMTLDGLPHQHSRYKIAITATYAVPPGGATAP